MGKKASNGGSKTEATPVRYAVVGLGYIAQIAVLPAFKHARANSQLAALISSDRTKLKELAQQYGVECTGGYDDFEQCLDEAQIDAVYIATPNTLHREFALRAARMGVHVLCEKPLASTVLDSEAIIRAARRANVKLMTAYRLHFEAANLEAIEAVKSGVLGEVKMFNAAFSMQVKPGNIRLERELAGGPLYDLGIYCINASRYILQQEPEEVMAFAVNSGDPRFKEVDESWAAILRFPDDQIATFSTSFGTADCGYYEVIGTKGRLRVEPAFEYAEALKHTLTVGEKTTTRTFSKRDQFAAELIYFSDCVINDRAVEPSGEEGLADIRIIEKIQQSARSGRRVEVHSISRSLRPSRAQNITKPPIRPPHLIHASAPHAE